MPRYACVVRCPPTDDALASVDLMLSMTTQGERADRSW